MAETLVLHASAAETASGAAAAVSVPASVRGDVGVCWLNVTAAAGTLPTLDALLQTTYDGGTSWIDVGAFTQLTAAGKRFLPLRGSTATAASTATADVTPTDATLTARTVNTMPIGEQVRLKWVVGGSAGQSFTFTALLYLR